MHRYRAFGLNIASEVLLEELSTETDDSRAIDLTIAIKKLGCEIAPMGEANSEYNFYDSGEVVMIWPGAAAVRIAGPNLVEIEPYPGVPETYLPFPLLGPVMGWVLHLRKLFTLHASSVLYGGRTFTFMGDKGAGKSTTAAAFLAAGAKLLTDDLFAVDTQVHQQTMIQPAFAQLKLSDEASANISVPGATPLPKVMEGFDKRQHRLDQLQDTAVPSEGLFILRRGGDKPKVEWMDDATALAHLIQFSYNVRFISAPIEQQDRKRHFQQCIALLRAGHVGFLHIPHDISNLHETVTYISAALKEKMSDAQTN